MCQKETACAIPDSLAHYVHRNAKCACVRMASYACRSRPVALSNYCAAPATRRTLYMFVHYTSIYATVTQWGSIKHICQVVVVVGVVHPSFHISTCTTRTNGMVRSMSNVRVFVGGAWRLVGFLGVFFRSSCVCVLLSLDCCCETISGNNAHCRVILIMSRVLCSFIEN